MVAHDEADTGATVITTQRLTIPDPTAPLVVIDVDAFRQGDFSADADELRLVLDSLRVLKNRTFFSLLTDQAVELFV